MKNQNIVIPQDFEAEQAILGSLIEDNELLDKILNILKPEVFYSTVHQYIFRAIVELNKKQIPVDEITLGDELKSLNQLEEIGGYGYLAELVESSPSAGNIVWYAQIIHDHAVLRDLITVTTDISRKARDPEQNVNELLIEAQEKILKISETKIQKNTFHIKEVLQESFQQLEKRSENNGEIIGIPTGFINLDKFTSGLIDEALIIIAARPAMGKTSFALNIVEYIHTGKRIKGATLVFTREMSKRQIAMRLLSTTGKVDNKAIKIGNLEQDEWDKLAIATDLLSSEPIYINKNSYTIDQVKHEARLLNRQEKRGLSLIVVDYIQLFKGSKKQPREQEISEITRELKSLALELEIPIIALSQLNRELEKRSDKRPQLSDLRESGAIEQDADIVIFIYRDEIYDDDTSDKGIAEIKISKHREGPTGTLRLQFIGKYTKFLNLSIQRL